ncbi:hypothetical protein PGQ11_001230 [Apiospora arundinis]|uniref:Uncharacterized protein n=1 Tax=Apiospora arundinis TaxID=335852 RepID=A0ABR2JN00_9PEZI
MSLISVHNHVHFTLLNVSIAPSTFITCCVLAFVFLIFYLIIGGGLPIPSLRLPSILPIPRFRLFAPRVHAAQTPAPTTPPRLHDRERRSSRRQKALPALPQQDHPLLQITDFAHNDPEPVTTPKRNGLKRFFSGPSSTRTPSPSRRSSSKSTSKKHHYSSSDVHASLDDFHALPTPPPTLPPSFVRYPSQRSGFAQSSMHTDDLDQESVTSDLMDAASSLSGGGYSPPAWRRMGNGDRDFGSWRKSDGGPMGLGFGRPDWHQQHHYDDGLIDDEDVAENDDVLRRAIRTRLPTGSLSPEKGRTPDPGAADEDDTLVKLKSIGSSPMKSIKNDAHRQSMMASMSPDTAKDNYIRFAVRADIQQRTEPIESAIKFVRSKFGFITSSWANLILATLVASLSIAAMRNLFAPANQRPVPDLVKVAGLARSFEPLIYYSENGVSQVGDLQATGVAVWDLGESVRSSNMTSAPTIVKSLDELSDSLKTLAIELTKFFANVDGDVDGILLVMDWARRELGQLQSVPNPPLATAFANIHNLLCNAGVLEDASGAPTRLGHVVSSVFGMSAPQRTRATLQRTFTEFLSVLEDAINSELQHSLALFGLFEAIDRQFLNLGRTVVRESSLQDDRHADLLSSLWTRLLGPNAGEIRKYEQNRQLLQNVREKTVRNKGVLVEHNGRLLTLKANLESLRRKLVSPLVRSVNSSTLTLEDQIKGLEEVGGYLEGVRARQKGKLMEMLYGSARDNGRQAVGAGGSNGRLIEENRWRS